MCVFLLGEVGQGEFLNGVCASKLSEGLVERIVEDLEVGGALARVEGFTLSVIGDVGLGDVRFLIAIL